jgi:hypothetical protein
VIEFRQHFCFGGIFNKFNPLFLPSHRYILLFILFFTALSPREDNYREINRRLQEAGNEEEARVILRQIESEMKNGEYTFPRN